MSSEVTVNKRLGLRVVLSVLITGLVYIANRVFWTLTETTSMGSAVDQLNDSSAAYMTTRYLITSNWVDAVSVLLISLVLFAIWVPVLIKKGV